MRISAINNANCYVAQNNRQTLCSAPISQPSFTAGGKGVEISGEEYSRFKEILLDAKATVSEVIDRIKAAKEASKSGSAEKDTPKE